VQGLLDKGYYDIFYVSMDTRLCAYGHQSDISACGCSANDDIGSMPDADVDLKYLRLQPPTGSPLNDRKANFWLPECSRKTAK
jgi:hypothetical protein